MARQRRAHLVAGLVLLWVQADVRSLRPTRCVSGVHCPWAT